MNKAVILIITHKPKLSEYELISLKQCYKVLAKHHIRLICPEGLDVSFYKENLVNPIFDFIDPKWQRTYENFNKLKINTLLYEKYDKYEYVLFYEPDAYVFRDELEYWCNKGYDYIGAPWFEGLGYPDKGAEYFGVGNGGFSLRNVTNTLKIIKKANRYNAIFEYAQKLKIDSILIRLGIMKKLVNKFVTISNNNIHEDIYIYKLSKLFDFYKIPPPDVALKFSFELLPKRLYELNNNSLPFGCHAWPKYDLNFWRPFILNSKNKKALNTEK